MDANHLCLLLLKGKPFHKTTLLLVFSISVLAALVCYIGIEGFFRLVFAMRRSLEPWAFGAGAGLVPYFAFFLSCCLGSPFRLWRLILCFVDYVEVEEGGKKKMQEAKKNVG